MTRRAARPSWPAVTAAGVLIALTAVALAAGLRATGGRLVYPLDDPYIHMAIARNLAVHGSWSVTPGRFEPASSSPLWTLILAAIDRVAGVHDTTPLVLNLLLAALIVLALDRLLRPALDGAVPRAVAALAIALAIPLPAIASAGMEAPLHVGLALALAAMVTTPDAGPSSWRTGALAIACVWTRFESLFLIGPLALIALRDGRRAQALALGLAALLAVAGYAAWSLAHGGLWLPNPVLAKAPVLDLRHALTRIPYQLFVRRFSHMTALLVAAGWLLLPRPDDRRPAAAGARRLLAAFVAAALLHVELAELGWFYRYEAYLVALGLVAVVTAVAAGVPLMPGRTAGRRAAPIAVALAVVVLAWPLAARAVRSWAGIAPAMRNIFEQQIQMATFVRRDFAGRAVAVNDLGAVGYYGRARVEDLMGLAAVEVTRARRAGRFDAGAVRRFCAARGVEVALVYPSWFTGATTLPASWIPVARWTVPEAVTVGDTTVTIFATGPGSLARVRGAVRSFRLPPRVRVAMLR